MENSNFREEVEIDLAEVGHLLFSKSLIIIVVALVTSIIAGIGTKFLITPQYTSSTSLYVISENDEDNLTSAALNKNTLLTQDYAELIKSRSVMNEVIKHNSLAMSSGELDNKVDVSIKNGTRIMNIEVTDPNPETAKQLADSVREEGAKHIQNVMESKSVKVVDLANIPITPSSPHIKKNMAFAAIVGIAISVAIIIIRHMLDDSIKSASDVENYLELSVLGSVPIKQEDKKTRKNIKTKRNKTKRNKDKNKIKNNKKGEV